MDSPAEYIASLEAGLRSERAARQRAESESADLLKEIESLNALREGLRMSCVAAAQVTERALAQLELCQPVVDAALDVCDGLAQGVSREVGEARCTLLVQRCQEYVKRGLAS